MKQNPNNEKTTGSAIYSLPHSQTFYEVKGEVSRIGPEEIFEESGFVFAPYDIGDLPILRISGHPKTVDISGRTFHVSTDCPYDGTPVTQADYRQLFEKSMDSIRSGELEKLVLSIRQVEERGFTNIGDFLKRLRGAYPQAFIYLFHIPEKECWIGASPELLLDTQYPFQRTVALAGTMQNGAAIADWRAKEREEQRLVEVFLDEVFKGRPYRKEGPAPVEAGPVYHLVTSYFLQIESTPVNPTEIHPSPALSGAPREKAVLLTQEIELHRRRYYTGFLGPVWGRGHSRFFINLRCLEVFAEDVALYAGGGLTADSDSEIEWMEIQHKLSTLRSRFHKGGKNNGIR